MIFGAECQVKGKIPPAGDELPLKISSGIYNYCISIGVNEDSPGTDQLDELCNLMTQLFIGPTAFQWDVELINKDWEKCLYRLKSTAASMERKLTKQTTMSPTCQKSQTTGRVITSLGRAVCSTTLCELNWHSSLLSYSSPLTCLYLCQHAGIDLFLFQPGHLLTCTNCESARTRWVRPHLSGRPLVQQNTVK